MAIFNKHDGFHVVTVKSGNNVYIYNLFSERELKETSI